MSDKDYTNEKKFPLEAMVFPASTTTVIDKHLCNKYPHADSMISGSKGVVFSVTQVSKQTIVIELHDPIKSETEHGFKERVINELSKLIGEAVNRYFEG